MEIVDDILTWPPNVFIKKHPRAKHVKLRATKQYGLELVVPKRFNVKEIPFILEQNRVLIEKQLRKILSESENNLIPHLPVTIHFPSIQQHWIVKYQDSQS